MKKIIVSVVSLVLILLTFSSCAENNTSSADTSSLGTSSNNTSSFNEELSDDMLAKIVAPMLDIPEDKEVTYTVSEKFYWDAGGCYYKDISFYEKDFLVAGASVDPANGEPIRNIYKYDDTNINFYYYFKDEYFAKSVAMAMGKVPYEAVTEEELASFSGKVVMVGDGENIKGVGYLRSITELEIAKNNVTEIPSEISECENLKRLGLLKAYNLEKLPENIGELENLEFLRISLTVVEKLPESIGNLKNLKYLYLDNCKISSVPESIGGCESLIVLDLHSTNITKIPDSVTRLKNLKSLDLGYTKITSLPQNIGELSELVRLDLFGLDIRRLPQSTKNLKKLEYLNVYNNYNLNEDYKQWFANECYKCTTDPENSEDWDDGFN